MENQVTFNDVEATLLSDRLTKWADKTGYARSLIVVGVNDIRAVINLPEIDSQFGWEAPCETWRAVKQLSPKVEKTLMVTFVQDKHPKVSLRGNWVMVPATKPDEMARIYPRSGAAITFEGVWEERMKVPEAKLDLSKLA